MTKTTNTMFDFDPSKMFDMSKMFGGFDATKAFADFDPSKMSTEFTKAFGDFKAPSVDMEPVMESQRKNIEAVVAANKLAVEGVQAVFKRQAEIFQKSLEEVNATMTGASTASNVQDNVAKQADALKAGLDTALVNMRELAEMINKSNTEAFDTVNKRFGESLEELKAQVVKLKA